MSFCYNIKYFSNYYYIYQGRRRFPFYRYRFFWWKNGKKTGNKGQKTQIFPLSGQKTQIFYRFPFYRFFLPFYRYRLFSISRFYHFTVTVFLKKKRRRPWYIYSHFFYFVELQLIVIFS
jgi:hypothetical protein